MAEVVRSLLMEVERDYKRSMKQAILDYVLKNKSEKERLHIPFPPPPLGREWGRPRL